MPLWYKQCRGAEVHIGTCCKIRFVKAGLVCDLSICFRTLCWLDMNPTRDVAVFHSSKSLGSFIWAVFEARAPPFHTPSTCGGSLDSICSRCRFRRELMASEPLLPEKGAWNAGRTRVGKQLGSLESKTADPASVTIPSHKLSFFWHCWVSTGFCTFCETWPDLLATLVLNYPLLLLKYQFFVDWIHHFSWSNPQFLETSLNRNPNFWIESLSRSHFFYFFLHVSRSPQWARRGARGRSAGRCGQVAAAVRRPAERGRWQVGWGCWIIWIESLKMVIYAWFHHEKLGLNH